MDDLDRILQGMWNIRLQLARSIPGSAGRRFELGSRSWRECENKGAREAVDIDHGEPRRRRRDHDRDFISDWWPSWVLAGLFVLRRTFRTLEILVIVLY